MYRKIWSLSKAHKHNDFKGNCFWYQYTHKVTVAVNLLHLIQAKKIYNRVSDQIRQQKTNKSGGKSLETKQDAENQKA